MQHLIAVLDTGNTSSKLKSISVTHYANRNAKKQNSHPTGSSCPWKARTYWETTGLLQRVKNLSRPEMSVWTK